MGCTTCGDADGQLEDTAPLPSAASGDIAVSSTVATQSTTTTCVTSKPATTICSTIKDECHNCPETPNPFARIKLTNAFAMPACDQEVEAVFDETISNLMVGLTLYAVDSVQRTIRLKITKITPDHKLTLKNVCSSCCPSTKPIGETVIAQTYFAWGLPDCCATAQSNTGSDCLIGTFYFPASGATAAATVSNSNNFVLGGLYSLGGFIWKVSARVTSTQLLLQNPAPGNGSVSGGFIEGGTAGVCTYPITPISEASECDDAAVAAVALIGCTTAGKKKLTGTDNCGLVKYDLSTGLFSVDHLFGGSSVTGPHYIQWDNVNPCNSRLVSSPDLLGASCSTITCALFLTPSNLSNEYEVEVASTTGLTSTAPNNIISLSGRQFTVNAIVTAGTPGKIRVRPRFAVTVSETIPTASQFCIVEGCQAFPTNEWPYACTADIAGERVYCATDGLRTGPKATAITGSFNIVQAADVGGIEVVGTYNRPAHSINIINPSACLAAVVQGIVAYVDQFTLDDDGRWSQEILIDEIVAATTVRAAITLASQNGQRRIDSQIMVPFTMVLAPGQTKVLNVRPQLRNTNASPNTALAWNGTNGIVTWHVTTI